MHKGVIVLVPFPFTDLSGRKVRPAIVLAVPGGGDCIVAFISSRGGKRKMAFEIPIAASEMNGLKVDSVIKVNKIATLQKKIVLGELGVTEENIMRTIDTSLKKLFEL